MLRWLRTGCVVLAGGLGVAAAFGGISTNLGGYYVEVGAADEHINASDSAPAVPGATIPFDELVSAQTGSLGAKADGTLAGTSAGFSGSYTLHTPPGLGVSAYYEAYVTEFTVDAEALFDFAANLSAGTFAAELQDVTGGTTVFSSSALTTDFSGSLEAGRLYALSVAAYVNTASQDGSGHFTFSVAGIPAPVGALLASVGLATALLLVRRS